VAVSPTPSPASSIARQLLPASLALLLLLLLRQSGLSERLNLFAYDLALHLRPAPSAASTPVRIVGIDEQDLARYGSPLPDRWLAEAVDRLDRLGAAAIGLDLFRAQPVGVGWRRLQHMAATNPRLVSVFFDLDGLKAIPGTPPHRQAAADLYTDPHDGVLRRDVLQIARGPQAFPVSLPARLLQLAQGRLDPRHPDRTIPLPPSTLSVGAGGYLAHAGVSAPSVRQRMLAFHEPGSFPTLSLRDLLRDPIAPATVRQLRGRIVLIGVVAPSSRDTFPVPFSPWRSDQRRFQLPGVEIHAHRVAALLTFAGGHHQGIQPVPASVNLLLLALAMGAGVAVGEGIRSLRRSMALASAGAFCGVVLATGALALGFWFDTLPLFAFALFAIAGLVRRASQQQLRGLLLEQQTLQARTMFARFVSRPVAEALLDPADPHAPSHQLRYVTVLTSDLRGFSLLSADHEPAVVLRLLNQYLDGMFEVVESFNGTIDEVLGDAILVLFGAPSPLADHAEAAVACALRMQLALEELNHRNRVDGLPELAMGIGLCSGEVMAGTIGSGRRAKYAVVGAAVNLATSIEALTVGGQVFAAASTIQRVSADLQLETLQPLPLKGSPEPLQLFSVRAIGAPHHLVLPPPPAAPLPLGHPLLVEVSLMEGKSRLEPWLAARITHWGGGQALLSLPVDSVSPFTNLVLRFREIESLAYAKVCGAAEGGVGIVFTFLPECLREPAPTALPLEPAPWVRPPDADRSPSTSP